MPNTNKRKGSAFEYDVKHIFEMVGFYGIRSYSSAGIADLVFTPSWNPRGNYRPLLVQCKNTKDEDYVRPHERDHLNYLQQINSGLVLIIYKTDSKVMVRYWESGKKIPIEEFLREEYGIPIESFGAILRAYKEGKRPIHLYQVPHEPYESKSGEIRFKPVSSFADFYSVDVWFPHVAENYRNKHK